MIQKSASIDRLTAVSRFIMYKCIGGQIILQDDEPYAAHLKSKAMEREVKKEQVQSYLLQQTTSVTGDG
ncbi:hypothetical protein AKJ16_DCAP01227 [Drosera capensis]